MDFPYIKLNEVIKRPLITVVVKHNNKAINYDVLIDSGADFNLFHAEIAEELGIDVKSGTPNKTYGVGDENGIECWFHDVSIFVFGEGIIHVPVAFSYQITTKGHGLLGQFGFFDHFVIRFDHREDKVSVKLRGAEPS